MKILITGGAGFIGSHVSEALLPEHQVVIVDNLSAGRRENVPAKARFYQTDIKDRPALDTIFRTEKPAAVIHLAAQKSVTKSVADPIHDAHENIVGSLSVFEAARSHQVKKIVFSSTGGALYGETTKIPTAENHPTLAESPYGIAKQTIEEYLRFYALTHQFQPVILRFANVYGPRQDPEGEAGVIAIFCHRLLKGEPIVIYGDGEQTRDYVYVKDAARAITQALTASGPLTVNVGTGREVPVNALVSQLQQLVGREGAVKQEPARPGELRRSALSAKRAKRELGWQPDYSLEQGLAETLAWFESRLR